MSGEATKRRRVDIVPGVSGEPVINGAFILQEISSAGVTVSASTGASPGAASSPGTGGGVLGVSATVPAPLPVGFPVPEASPGHALMKPEEEEIKPTPRRRTGTKTSVWTTVAVISIENNRARCALCGKVIAVSGVSSSNIVAHYQKWHRNVYADVAAAESAAAKREVLEAAINAANSMTGRKPDLPVKSARPKQRPRPTTVAKTERRVTALLFAATYGISMDTLTSPELAAFVTACGGTLDIDINSYHALLPTVHYAATRISDTEAGISLKVSHVLHTAVKQAILDFEFLRTVAHRDVGSDTVDASANANIDDERTLRWCSELTALEKYVEMKRCSTGADIEALRADPELKCILDCIAVLNELRRVAIALEEDRRVSAARAPRLLWELVKSFDNHLVYEDKLAREVASKVRDHVHERSRSMYEPVPRELALDGMGTSVGTTTGVGVGSSNGNGIGVVAPDGNVDSIRTMAKQALSLHVAALFDINECNFEWYPDPTTKPAYIDLIADVAVAELSGMLKDEFDPNLHNKANLLTVHEHMVKHLSVTGRKQPAVALDWWAAIENSSVVELRKRKLYIAAMFVEPARAFLSPVVQHLNKIDDINHNLVHDQRETMAVLRSLLRSRIESSTIQRNSRASVVRKLATDIAHLVENTV